MGIPSFIWKPLIAAGLGAGLFFSGVWYGKIKTRTAFEVKQANEMISRATESEKVLDEGESYKEKVRRVFEEESRVDSSPSVFDPYYSCVFSSNYPHEKCDTELPPSSETSEGAE